MTGYGQYCPIARAIELLGERWTLLVVRDLIHGARRFNELSRGLPRMSRGLLSKRLQQLESAGIVEKRVLHGGTATEYHLTRAGEELRPVLEALLVWGANWTFEEPDPGELDPVLLMWWMRRRVCPDRLPPQRVVVQFDFREDRDRSYWMLLEPQDVSVCMRRPAFDIDVWIDAALSAFYQVWLGRIGFADAVADGSIEVRALPALERAFPTWFAWSPAAEVVRATKR